jgi:outer membrane protein assembly factor BamB
MRFPAFRLPALLALPVLIIAAGFAPAVIMKLTHLSEVLEGDDFIFVATVDKLDPEKPLAVFKVEKKLKGDPSFERMPVNMTGNEESKKANDTRTIFDRLDPSRKVVFFISKRGKKYNAKAFVEGTWFSVQGTEDETDKVVRWAFQSGEPFLRRTFKGTTAELVKVCEDGLSGKAKPPLANEKEKEGYGPAVEKKEPKKDAPEERGHSEEDRGHSEEDRGQRTEDSPELVCSLASSVLCSLSSVLFRMSSSECPPTSGPALFGVIPSFALVGPLAVIAALFPGLFAKMAVGMKRWRAFLVVASINSTLGCLYWVLQTWWPSALPSGWWGGLKAFTLLLMVISAVGLSWAGRRYRRMAAEDASVTSPPSKLEIYALTGLTGFLGLVVLLYGVFGDWPSTVHLPMREITFIGIALGVATLYAAYRKLTLAADNTPTGTAPERRLSVSGEAVALGTLLLCGFTVLVTGNGSGPLATGGDTGDAEPIGPRYVGVKTFEVKKSHQVMSGITVVGDRLYFGAQYTRSSQEGQMICLDRESGEEKWRFEGDDDLLPVFCTPTLADGRVYCGEGLHTDKGCRLFCVHAADGKPAWEKPFKTGSHTEGAPAVLDGKVFFPAGDDGLFAVDAKTGAQLWRLKGGKDAGIHIDAAPAVNGNRVFVGSGLYTFFAICLDANTGKELWRTDLKSRAFGAPFASGKFVYYGVGTGNMSEDTFHYPEEGEKKDPDRASGAVVCLEADSGKEVWRYDLPKSVHTGLVGDAFSVYAACRDGNIYAIDRTKGKLRWSRGTGGPATTAPAAVATASGVPVAVYAVSSDGNLVCLNPHTGAVVWQKRLPGFHYFPGEHNDVLSGPVVVTTPTPTGNKRAIYVGAMIVDSANYAKKTCAVFRFEDELGE